MEEQKKVPQCVIDVVKKLNNLMITMLERNLEYKFEIQMYDNYVSARLNKCKSWDTIAELILRYDVEDIAQLDYDCFVYKIFRLTGIAIDELSVDIKPEGAATTEEPAPQQQS